MEGGLYQVISRGNNRRKVFRTAADYRRFNEIMLVQKSKLPFYLYAYCLMPNHIHLLIERREDSVSKIMQRILTTYSRITTGSIRRSGMYSGTVQGDIVPDRSVSGKTGEIHSPESSKGENGQEGGGV
jgi:REP element-mobilizing transposase RayT